jgi:hypothetical protein
LALSKRANSLAEAAEMRKVVRSVNFMVLVEGWELAKVEGLCCLVLRG